MAAHALASEPDTTAPGRPSGARAWLRPALLVLSCLVIGFIAGWVLRGDDGPATALAPPAPESAGAPAATTGATTTAPATTAPTTEATTAAEPANAPPARDAIQLAVLTRPTCRGPPGARPRC